MKFDFHILPSGLINPLCSNIIGNGVVIHIPSFFAELDALKSNGIDPTGRLFISNRCHLVFDFHRIVDGIKEFELGRGGLGTTRKGIGPAYSSKASRSGIRMHHLFDYDEFEKRLRMVVGNRRKRYGDFEYCIEKELELYRKLAEKVKPFVIDSVPFINKQLSLGKRVLVEGT